MLPVEHQDHKDEQPQTHQPPTTTTASSSALRPTPTPPPTAVTVTTTSNGGRRKQAKPQKKNGKSDHTYMIHILKMHGDERYIYVTNLYVGRSAF